MGHNNTLPDSIQYGLPSLPALNPGGFKLGAPISAYYKDQQFNPTDNRWQSACHTDPRAFLYPALADPATSFAITCSYSKYMTPTYYNSNDFEPSPIIKNYN